MQNAPSFPGIYHSAFSLPAAFPLHYRLDGKRDDRPIDAFHTHNVLELGLCLEGAGTYQVAGKLLPFQAGDVTVITPLEWHRSQSVKGSVSTWAWFFFDPARLLVPSLTRDLPYVPEAYAGRDFQNVLPGTHYPGLVTPLQELVHEGRTKGEGHESNMRALLLVFLNRLHHHIGRKRHGRKRGFSSTPARIMPALNEMARRYAEPLRIEDLAGRCHMSLRNFQLHFRRIVGEAPQSHLIQCRVKAAVAQLRATDLTVAEIAYQCGFGSLSSFNRAFRAHTGRTPSSFRKA